MPTAEDRIKDKLKEQQQKRIEALAGADKELYREIKEELNWSYSRAQMDSLAQCGAIYKQLDEGKKPSEILSGYRGCICAIIPERFFDDFLYIADKYNRFPYSYGTYRPTVRMSSYHEQMHSLLNSLVSGNSRPLWAISGTLDSVYSGTADAEETGFFMSDTVHAPIVSGIIAARIDRGDKALEDAIYDLIMSEGGVVSYTVIRAVVMSGSERLYEALCRLLLAAKLQEGLRQAICEFCDSGTPEAFIAVYNTIVENDLVRYSSVKRAVCCWTGLGGSDSRDMDRLTKKQLGVLSECLASESARAKYLDSSDAVEIYLSVWAEGFFDTHKAADVIRGIIHNGTRHQALCVSYYLHPTAERDELSREAILAYPGDLEMFAAYEPFFLGSCRHIYQLSSLEYGSPRRKQTLEELGMTREQALRFYEIFKGMYEAMPKKAVKYDPFIFPWYSAEISRSDPAQFACRIGYALDEQPILDECCELLLATNNRSNFLSLFAERPTREKQYETLLACIPDREEYTRKTAAKIAEDVQWREKDYPVLEAMLKYKAGDVRATVISQLMRQDTGRLCETVKRLIASKKEEMRAGGLDLMLNMSRDEKYADVMDGLRECLKLIESPTQKELILIEQLSGKEDHGQADVSEGFGLYTPGARPEISDEFFSPEGPDFKEYFSGCAEECSEILAGLGKLIKDNEKLEYTTFTGEKQLLGDNGFSPTKPLNSGKEIDRWPFPELWRGFWEQHSYEPKSLLLLRCAVRGISRGYYQAKLTDELDALFLGGIGLNGLLRDGHTYTMSKVINLLCEEYVPSETMVQAAEALIRGLIRLEPRQLFFEQPSYYGKDIAVYFCGDIPSISVAWEDSPAENDGQARRLLSALLKLNEHMRKAVSADDEEGDKTDKKAGTPGEPMVITGQKIYNSQLLNAAQYIHAWSLGIITKRDVYTAIFERLHMPAAIGLVSSFAAEKLSTWRRNQLLKGFGKREYAEKIMGPESDFMRCSREIYSELLELIIPIELKRGDTPTFFSETINRIEQIYGAEYFVQAITALGRDTLNRTDSSWRSDTTRRCVFSHLISVSQPRSDDTPEKLAELVKKAKITDKRLVEAAMYAPDWIELIGEVLGWDGFTAGCYYFIAHMKTESNDDKRSAVIARYTPLSPEELCEGAFDVDWFGSSYEQLGEQRFELLYDAAKYICSGSRHSRARKYADARLGKLDVSATEREIGQKRGKDTLMAYALIPLSGDDDTLRRYSFIKVFQKQAKQYGAQRRQSETKAAEMALRNLALNAGFDDSMRLTLAMETALTEGMSRYFEWREIDGVQLRAVIDEEGKCSVECEKNGKALKSLPAALKKNEYAAELKEAVQTLRDQYSRTRAMLEQAMENRTEFAAKELNTLLSNPVAAPMLSKLVYVRGGELGLIGGGVPDGDSVRIAHPFDMFASGKWRELQQLIFDRKIKQPFKQVFRELYVKTEDERQQYNSLRFAGNQILPQRTVGALRGRRWIADYDEGLQKIFYKENLVARIYALADWFSPADIEAPTLEWVEFSDRMSGRPVKIDDVPDVIFSEVMRDVDLAVSVAHAGGVDPETSRSTIELRRAVVEFNLPLFGLDNVELTDTHAVIEGQRARYSVHLGSGAVHIIGGTQIAVLPVHSQQRGRIFLPFIDDDPKTAEIISKIVMFAEDGKIKDPSILSQIV